MSDDLIPKKVREFIESNIDSIAELEALLLIRREPETEWTSADLAERLYITAEQTDIAMLKLHTLGIAGVKGRGSVIYQYQPSSDALDRVVSEVAEAYSKYLIPVTNLIHSKLESRVQEFADAFRLRKKTEK